MYHGPLRKSKEEMKMEDAINQLRQLLEQMNQEQRKNLLEFINKLKEEIPKN